MPGRTYLDAGYDINVADVWRRNFIVLCGWILFFQFTQIIALDFFPHAKGGGSFRLFAKEDNETKALNKALQEKKAKRAQLNESEKAAAMENTDKRDACVLFSLGFVFVLTRILVASLAHHSPIARPSPGRA